MMIVECEFCPHYRPNWRFHNRCAVKLERDDAIIAAKRLMKEGVLKDIRTVKVAAGVFCNIEKELKE